MMERIPPQNLEAERAVLGSMMLESAATTLAAAMLDIRDFYPKRHRAIFKAACEVNKKGGAADQITIAEVLRAHKWLEKAGGEEYLYSLTTAVPSAANIDHYAKIVRECAAKRRLIVAGSTLLRDVEEGMSAEEAEAKHAERLKACPSGMGWHTMKDMLGAIPSEGPAIPRFKVGFAAFDRVCGGLPRGLCLFGGPPGAGKTTLALQIALRANNAGEEVHIFNGEMGKDEIAVKLWCCEAGVPEANLRQQFNTKDGLTLYERLEERKIYLDAEGMDLQHILATIRFRATTGVRWFIVDYLSLVRVQSKESAFLRQEEAAVAIKRLQAELGLWVILIVGYTKNSEDPIRGSKDVQHAADMILTFNAKEPDSLGDRRVEMSVTKNRHGPTGDFDLTLVGAWHRFKDAG